MHASKILIARPQVTNVVKLLNLGTPQQASVEEDLSLLFQVPVENTLASIINAWQIKAEKDGQRVRGALIVWNLTPMDAVSHIEQDIKVNWFAVQRSNTLPPSSQATSSAHSVDTVSNVQGKKLLLPTELHLWFHQCWLQPLFFFPLVNDEKLKKQIKY